MESLPGLNYRIMGFIELSYRDKGVEVPGLLTLALTL
jgi:hypothetical protein